MAVTIMSDGHPIRVTAEFLSPSAVNAADLIEKATKQQAGLLQWNRHIYVLHGLEFFRMFDNSTNVVTLAIHKLMLWDTRFSDARRNAVFDRETVDLGKLQGYLFLPGAGAINVQRRNRFYSETNRFDSENGFSYLRVACLDCYRVSLALRGGY